MWTLRSHLVGGGLNIHELLRAKSAVVNVMVKRRGLTASCMNEGDERKQTPAEASKRLRWHQNRSVATPLAQSLDVKFTASPRLPRAGFKPLAFVQNQTGADLKLALATTKSKAASTSSG